LSGWYPAVDTAPSTSFAHALRLSEHLRNHDRPRCGFWAVGPGALGTAQKEASGHSPWDGGDGAGRTALAVAGLKILSSGQMDRCRRLATGHGHELARIFRGCGARKGRAGLARSDRGWGRRIGEQEAEPPRRADSGDRAMCQRYYAFAWRDLASRSSRPSPWASPGPDLRGSDDHRGAFLNQLGWYHPAGKCFGRRLAEGQAGGGSSGAQSPSGDPTPSGGTIRGGFLTRPAGGWGGACSMCRCYQITW